MSRTLTEEEMKNELLRLAPFHHEVELPYGLSTYVPEKSRRHIENTRIRNLVNHAFPALLNACGGSFAGKRILDVACNCGGFSVEAAKHNSEYVLGIDIVDHYIEQANFIKNALGLGQVDFKVMDIEKLEKENVGQFDVTLCFGILYHLENPIHVMKQVSSVTKKIMLVDTNVMTIPTETGKPLWLMNFPPISTAMSNDVSTSLWRSGQKAVQFNPNETAVVEMLKFLGFSKVEVLKPVQEGLEERYYSGRRATFLAVRA